MVACLAASCSAHDVGGDRAPDAQDTSSDTVPFESLDARLEKVLAEQSVEVGALDPLPAASTELVALGELLFFDPILSGNRDVACATCHDPARHTSDGLVLSLGTGVRGSGLARERAPHDGHLPRRAPFLWNRGRMDVLFWDGRVDGSVGGVAQDLALPPGTWTDPLAVQAMHPLANAREMRGAPGDLDVFGDPNELASGSTADLWHGLVGRLASVPAYSTAFQQEFGKGWGIEEVANALAAFQRARFDPTDTPWDRYLRGDEDALADDAKLGALQFFAQERCSVCHAGGLLTDQRVHNVGVPLIEPVDRGRADRTGLAGDRFAFRTPPLRNAALGGPYFHNGSMPDLAAVLKHYGDPEATPSSPPEAALPDDLGWSTDGAARDELLGSLSPDLPTVATGASLVGLSNLRAFLEALVDEDVAAEARVVPEAVPSGLRVGGGGPPP